MGGELSVLKKTIASRFACVILIAATNTGVLSALAAPEQKPGAFTPIKSKSEIPVNAAKENPVNTAVNAEREPGSPVGVPITIGTESEKEAAAIAAAAYAEREAKRRALAMELSALHNEALDHYELSRVYLSRWNAEMAEVELQASIMCEPNIKVVHRDYCLVALMQGNPLKAIAEAMMVVGLGEPIPLDDQQKIKLKEKACKVHYVKGIAIAQEKKWQEAITEFQWALSYQPNNARVTRSMAFAYGSLGDFTRAEKEYAASFAMDPTDAFSHADLAFLLKQSGDTKRALEQLEAAVALQPKVAALRVDLAWLAESQGNLELASSEFEEAIKLAPKHAALYTHLGKLFARQGLPDKAIDAYKAALALDPAQHDAAEGLNSLQSGPTNHKA